MPVYGLRGKGCKWQIVQCLLRGLPVQCPSRAFPSPRLCRGSWLLGVSSFFLKNAELLPSPRRSFASIWHGEKVRIQEETGVFQRNAFWEPTMPFWVKPNRSHPSGYTKTIRIPFVYFFQSWCWRNSKVSFRYTAWFKNLCFVLKQHFCSIIGENIFSYSSCSKHFFNRVSFPQAFLGTISCFLKCF